VSGSFPGSLTIGNENPFQAHSVLESSSDFRLILRLENVLGSLGAAFRGNKPGESALRSTGNLNRPNRWGLDAAPMFGYGSDYHRSDHTQNRVALGVRSAIFLLTAP